MAKFKKGTSGNPRGRIKGIPDRRTQARELFAQHRDELVGVAIEKALAGDMQALRLCLERICPPIRATDSPVNLGTLPPSLAEKGEHVLRELAAGKLAPDTAATIMVAIANHARITEVSQLEQRIAALEAGDAADPGREPSQREQ